MAYELINNGPATPQRIHALIRLLGRKDKWDRTEVLDIIQPTILDAKQPTARTVLSAANSLGLVDVTNDVIRLHDSAKGLSDAEAFRRHLVSSSARALNENHPNYRFNLFTAWYATKNEDAILINNNDLTIAFNTQVPFESEDRTMNSTKFNAWRTLASFLGYGWIYSGTFVPDATVRLRPIIPELLPTTANLPLATFVSNLAAMCPELDRGELFQLAWKHGRHDRQGNRLSLMLSNALRRLQADGSINLERVPDARDTWQLFPASGFTPNDVTHISRGLAV